MIKDPIVEEIHKVRAQMMKECGNDISKLFELIRRREQFSATERKAKPKASARSRRVTKRSR